MLFNVIAAALFMGSAVQPYTASSTPASAQSYGYTVSNYDQDLLYARQQLDMFWGDPYTTPGNENAWYTAPGLSWLNEAGGTATACGTLTPDASKQKGFFYCPADKVIYVDYTDLRGLHSQWGYDGVLAMLAHEYGHHVQNLMGSLSKDHSQAQELQADCASGMSLRWLQGAMPRLSSTELGQLAYWTGGGSPENTSSHGTGAERQRWWLFGWDQYNKTTRSNQFVCFTAIR